MQRRECIGEEWEFLWCHIETNKKMPLLELVIPSPVLQKMPNSPLSPSSRHLKIRITNMLYDLSSQVFNIFENHYNKTKLPKLTFITFFSSLIHCSTFVLTEIFVCLPIKSSLEKQKRKKKYFKSSIIYTLNHTLLTRWRTLNLQWTLSDSSALKRLARRLRKGT